MTSLRTRAQALGVLALAPTLAAVVPSPSTAWPRLVDLHSTGTPLTAATAPFTAAVALAAWACSGWLLLVVATTCGSHLPGAAGQGLRHAARRVAPAPVRSLVRVALGTTVVLSALGGTSSAFAETQPSYDWPGVSTPATAPPAPVLAHQRPTPPAVRKPPAVLMPPAGPHSAGRSVVVQPGDSLWAIAARELGPAATSAQVALAWPRWWGANRAVVGDDPGLIHPGTHLSVPRPA